MSRFSTLLRFRKETLDVLADDCARLVELIIAEIADLRLAFAPKLTFSSETVLTTDTRLVLKVGVIPRIDSTSATVDVYLPSLKAKDAGAVVGAIKLVAANSVRFNTTDGTFVNGLSATSASVTSAGLSALVWDGRIWWLQRG